MMQNNRKMNRNLVDKHTDTVTVTILPVWFSVTKYECATKQVDRNVAVFTNITVVERQKAVGQK